MLASLEREVRSEPSLLSKAMAMKVKRLPRGTILVGAGDSYAAALCASYLSEGACTVINPYELIISPETARSRTVAFLSVSGRTRSNVAAARSVKSKATETLAITADMASPLAKAVGRIVVLPYDYRPRTPGMASFSLMLAACSRLLQPNLHVNFAGAFSAAKRISASLRFSKSGVTFFLGNSALYGVAFYAAAKLYEFFGAKAACQRLDEFSHMELFSLTKRDAVNIYEGFDPLKIGRSLSRSLRAAGYDSHLATTQARNDADRVFAAVFATQLAVLRRAKGLRMERPYLSGARKKLALSDSMIY